MRRLAALAAPALVSAALAVPAAAQDLATMAGETNMSALNAAASCQIDDAMALAGKAAKSKKPGERLFAEFIEAALLTETGKPKDAAAVVDAVTADKALNPDKASREQMQQGADALLQTIQSRRQATTGKATC
ncbi:MAG: hypothetical protein JNK88_08810 [Mangrovicoccus sp.]|nr:hypothetical protein [Mangrovicoccus sp.]